MKNFFLIVILAFSCLWQTHAQTTFGPYRGNVNGGSVSVLIPSSYYSPVTTDTITPYYNSPYNTPAYRWKGCTGAKSLAPLSGANSIVGYGGITNFDSHQYLPYTFERPNYASHLNFRILFPKNYNPSNSKKYPLIIHLHGTGQAGISPFNNDCDPRNSNNDGQLSYGGKYHLDLINNDTTGNYQAIVVFPQNDYYGWANASGWAGPSTPNIYDLPYAGTVLEQSSLLLEAIKFMRDGGSTTESSPIKFNVDPNRIYIEGYSGGTSGLWDCIVRNPDVFAGAIPMSGTGTVNQADLLKYIGIWNWQGGTDTNPQPYYTQIAIKAMQAVSGFRRDNQYTDITKGINGSGTSTNTYIGNKRYIEESSYGHGVFTDGYSHPDFWRWLFSQNQLNIVPFGDTAFCQGDPINVKIGILPNMLAYDWQYSSDGISYVSTLPDGAANTTHDIVVTTLGYYRVRFQRTGSGWTNYSQPIQIATRYSPAPVITRNNSFVLPSIAGSSVKLSVPAGMVSYMWSTGDTTSNITVNSAGTYTVSLKPPSGCPSSFASIKIITVPGPNPPNAAPTNLTASTLASNSIILNWRDNSTNETGFEIFRSTTSGSGYVYVTTTTANVVTYTETTLTPGVTYYYKVRAVNADGASAYTSEATASTQADISAPTSPNNLLISSIGYNTMTLTWTASTDNMAVTTYDVYQNGSLITSVTTPGYTATGLVGGTEYTYKVIARDAAGNSSIPSNQVSAFAYTIIPGKINYSFYTNATAFTSLNSPLFNGNAPVKTGYVTFFDISPRTQNTNFGFKFDGYITVPTQGLYTFYTESDDGSNLFVNGYQVVFNDYNQTMTERSGTIYLYPDTYPIQVTYRQGSTTYGLNVRWEGPGISKQIVPSGVLSGYDPGKIFYIKSSGTPADTANWGMNSNGTGVNPHDFTSNNQVFYVTRSLTLDNDWVLSGTNSRIVVKSGFTLTIPNNKSYTGRIDVEGTGSVLVQNTTVPTFGNLSTTSTVNFSSVITIPDAPIYGNVTLSGSGAKNFSSNTYNIMGNLTTTNTLGSVTSSGGPINLAGNFTLGGNLTLPIDIVCVGGSQTFKGNGNAFKLNSLTLNSGSSVLLNSVSTSSNLTLGNNASSNLILKSLSTLNLSSNTLTIGTGGGVINPNSETGTITTAGGAIVINSNSANNSNLYFTPAANSLKNMTINETGTGNVFLRNQVQLTSTLTMTNGNLNTTNGTFILVSNSTGSARIPKLGNNASITGKVTWQRYFSGSSSSTLGWYHLGVPVKSQKVSDWSDNAYIQGPFSGRTSSIQYYHEYEYKNPGWASTNSRNYENSGWYGINSQTDSILAGKGVRIYLYNEFFLNRGATFDNVGQPVIGDGADSLFTTGEKFDFKVTYTPLTGYDNGGWNLVSNPYPSDIDWGTTTTINGYWTKTGISPVAYVWDSKANSGKGQYTQYNSTTRTGLNGGTGRIAQGQAFFIKAIAANPVLKVLEDAKSSTATSLLKEENVNPVSNMLRIQLKNKVGYTDETLVFFTKKATANFDLDYDSYKLYGASINISTLSGKEEDLSMNALPQMSGQVKVNLKNNYKGDYTLNFTSLETFVTGVNIYLIDKFNNTQTNIFTQPLYSFTISDDTKSYGSERFVIVFEPIAVVPVVETVKEFGVLQNSPNPFANETNITFAIPSDGQVSVLIYNQIGVKIDQITESFTAGSHTIKWNSQERIGRTLQNGVYLYKVIYGNQVITKRMISIK